MRLPTYRVCEGLEGLLQCLQRVLILTAADILLWLVSKAQSSLLRPDMGHHTSLLECMWCLSTGPHTCLPTWHSPCRLIHVWLTACLSGPIRSFNEHFKILRTALLNSFPSRAAFNNRRTQCCLTRLLHPSSPCALPRPLSLPAWLGLSAHPFPWCPYTCLPFNWDRECFAHSFCLLHLPSGFTSLSVQCRPHGSWL